MKWVYGITTVPSRRATLFPRTLASLTEAGFDKPHVFVDGDADPNSWRAEFDLDVTAHYPKLRAVGNWITALWTLYLLDPSAHRFALFQDDVAAVRGLRAYLDGCPWQEKTYRNLYTAEDSETSVIGKGGWVPGRYLDSNVKQGYQCGRGALGLVLDTSAVIDILQTKGVAEKPLDLTRGHQNLDGMVVNALNSKGYVELVHSPSLLQHTGQEGDDLGKPNPLTSMEGHIIRARSITFPGERFDAKELLKT